jgi:hypothetical protein
MGRNSATSDSTTIYHDHIYKVDCDLAASCKYTILSELPPMSYGTHPATVTEDAAILAIEEVATTQARPSDEPVP